MSSVLLSHHPPKNVTAEEKVGGTHLLPLESPLKQRQYLQLTPCDLITGACILETLVQGSSLGLFCGK